MDCNTGKRSRVTASRHGTRISSELLVVAHIARDRSSSRIQGGDDDERQLSGSVPHMAIYLKPPSTQSFCLRYRCNSTLTIPAAGRAQPRTSRDGAGLDVDDARPTHGRHTTGKDHTRSRLVFTCGLVH